MSGLLVNLLGNHIARPRSFIDHAWRYAIEIVIDPLADTCRQALHDGFDAHRRDRRSRREGFEAAAIATAAQRPVEVNRLVPQLAACAADAEMQLAVDDQAAADAGADAETRDRLDAAPRAELPFAECHRARIVQQRGGQLHARGNRVAQGNVRPRARQIRQKQRQAVFQIEHPRRTDANAADLRFAQAAVSDHVLDQIGHTAHHGIVAFARQRRHRPQMRKYARRDVDHRRAQVRPA